MKTYKIVYLDQEEDNAITVEIDADNLEEARDIWAEEYPGDEIVSEDNMSTEWESDSPCQSTECSLASASTIAS